jgi:hypothetical protein
LNFYEILDIGQAANDEEIRTAFRRLAKQYHPDVSSDPDASARFRLVYIAYDTLKDPVKRRLYDQMQHGDISFIPVETIDGYNMTPSQYERWQRRAARRAAYYERMKYEEFEEKETVGDKFSFHFRQIFAFALFFCFLVAGLCMIFYGFHFILYEHFNGSKIAGYAFWALGGALTYTCSKALLGVFDSYWKK